ncbi:MAG: 30S ribosomal protein S13 [Patescibacteria group bacterium]|nr:30S ribosomal protein S13 [Patescibacteria group bacterium]
MARVAGVNIPQDKHIEIALTYVYGIGRTTSNVICTSCGIDPQSKTKDIQETQLDKVREYISKNLVVEGDKRRQVAQDIKRLQDIGSYRGYRHRRSLPVRGQGTKNNARTRKGRKKTVANKKK